jgi:hypothetical protein
VTAKNKKYSVLSDTKGRAVARERSTSVTLKQGDSWTWWAKYPAPPSDIKNITYVTPLTVPFEDLPVTD